MSPHALSYNYVPIFSARSSSSTPFSMLPWVLHLQLAALADSLRLSLQVTLLPQKRLRPSMGLPKSHRCRSLQQIRCPQARFVPALAQPCSLSFQDLVPAQRATGLLAICDALLVLYLLPTPSLRRSPVCAVLPGSSTDRRGQSPSATTQSPQTGLRESRRTVVPLQSDRSPIASSSTSQQGFPHRHC